MRWQGFTRDHARTQDARNLGFGYGCYRQQLRKFSDAFTVVAKNGEFQSDFGHTE
jgi:hypothetical protein